MFMVNGGPKIARHNQPNAPEMTPARVTFTLRMPGVSGRQGSAPPDSRLSRSELHTAANPE
jgi:nucleoid-associated protein YgaU